MVSAPCWGVTPEMTMDNARAEFPQPVAAAGLKAVGWLCIPTCPGSQQEWVVSVLQSKGPESFFLAVGKIRWKTPLSRGRTALILLGFFTSHSESEAFAHRARWLAQQRNWKRESRAIPDPYVRLSAPAQFCTLPAALERLCVSFCGCPLWKDVPFCISWKQK